LLIFKFHLHIINPHTCFLQIRSTSRSTLFPYTTLFRSCAVELRDRQGDGRQTTALVIGPDRANHDAELVLLSRPQPHVRADTDQDRKSTRLNSSHVKISYAVFCLKKKK